VFDYEDVRVATQKNTLAYNFPDADGTYVQDLGKSGRRFPFRMFIWGSDYDTESDLFEAALVEPGIGKLEHPVYGVIDVVPFGAITRRDDLKTNANQAIFDVTFFETIGLVYPTVSGDPASSVVTAVDEYNEAQAQQFDNSTNLDSALEQSTAKGSYQALTDQSVDVLQVIADTTAAVQSQFNAIRDSINQSIDTLIGEPLTLAFQSALLLQAPARANALIADRLSAYGDLLDTVTEQLFVPGLDSSNSNDFHAADVYASGYVSASVLSVVNNQFEIKTDALAAAETILDQMDKLTEWRDTNFGALVEIDTGEAYQQLIEAVGLAAGFLVEISFTLKQEKRFVTVRNRSFLELCAELYGVIDDETLNFFINSNALSGAEIIEIPSGREVVYYV
jgi:hypothetical protein